MRKNSFANSSAIRSEYPTQVPLQQRCQRCQRCHIAASILFGMLLALGAMPESSATLSGIAGDKILRFLAYASISTLLYAGVSGSPSSRALITLALVGVMGAVEESIQLMLPYHSANLLGWKFDMLVALTCVGMLMMLHPVFGEWSASQQLRPARIRPRPTPMRCLHRRRNAQ